MFTKATRNERLLNAYVRFKRSEKTVQRAEEAKERHEAAKAEVEWYKTAPVRDGAPGEELPTQEELDAYLESVRAKVRRPTEETDGQQSITPQFQ